MNLGAKLNPKKNVREYRRIYQHYKTYISHTCPYIYLTYITPIYVDYYKVIEPLLAGKIAINKDRSLTSEKLLPINSIKYADLGYQGLQSNVVIPFKRLKNLIETLLLLE